MQLQYITFIQCFAMRVLVVGAGLSGLTAARQLLKRNPNISLTVTEGLNRVGGRTNTVDINGCKFDLGAEFIGQTQNYIKSLAQESGNNLRKVYKLGAKLIQINKTVELYNSGHMKSPKHMLENLRLQAMIWRINFLASKIPILNPKQYDQSEQFDKMTVLQWVEKNVKDQKSKFLFQSISRGILGVEMGQVSFLYFLWFIHQNKDVKNMMDIQNALQEYNTQKGTQYFSQFLAEQVRKMGGVIELGVKVDKVQQKDNKCIVRCNDGKQLVSDYLLMACSPWQANRIEYSPPLSKERKHFFQQAFMGSYGKIIILYKKAYWREKGFCGQMSTDCKDSPIVYAYDDSRQNDRGQLQPALQVFLGGKIYDQWKNNPNMEQQIIKKLASLINEPEMLHPIAIKWKAWEQQQTIGGGPTGNLGPGVLSQISDLRKPEKNIHWAGTELATVSIGYMDGAVESGKRAAAEISKRINRQETIEQQQFTPMNKNWYEKYFKGVVSMFR